MAKLNKIAAAVAAVALGLSAGLAQARVSVDLPYPDGTLDDATAIMEQVYFVNHFYSYKNFAIEKVGRDITVLISRAEGGRPTTNTVERYLNNNYVDDPEIRAMDLAIFRSGKLRGTGLLVTDYDDENKSQSYQIWLPALRKIRRFAEPAQDDSWGGTDFTFGDVVLRKVNDENHEFLGKETFNECLGGMDIPEDQQNRYIRDLPGISCVSKGKEVYKVKSTTKFQNWWYDYRVSYVDAKSFADYRTEFFKDGKKIKFIDRDWKHSGLDDPRANIWGYWYGKNLETNHETWAVIPESVVKFNQDYPDDLWSEKSLRKIKQ